MVSGAIHVVVGGNLYWLWLAASIGAAVFYMLICFRCRTETQITVAGYMSTFYAILMLAVTVGKCAVLFCCVADPQPSYQSRCKLKSAPSWYSPFRLHAQLVQNPLSSFFSFAA